MTPRLRRPFTALLWVPLMLTACGAGADPQRLASPAWPATQPFPPAWPTTQPAPPALPRTPPFPTWPEPAAAQRALATFHAPSAPHCARPIRTREVPGLAAQEQARADASGERSPLERWRKGEGAGAGWAAAATSPAPAIAPHTFAEPSRRSAKEGHAEPDAIGPEPAWPRQQQQPDAAPVTAGVVDDNADFAAYLAFRERTQVPHRPRDVRERYLLQVNNRRGQPLPDAEVSVRSPAGHAMWARSDAGGRVWLHPDAFDPARAPSYEVLVRHAGQLGSARLVRGQKSALEVVVEGAPAQARARLDLVFLIDATGSMADEISKLRSTLRTIADQVARLPSRPDICFALVAYRDRGDVFLLRSHDFTNDLGAFQGVLDNVNAGGGGDYPEALNEALHETVHGLSWRGDGATRMVLLLADAPPHLDRGGPYYDDDMVAALGKGIKIFSVGASGLDRQGEYVQRQLAQYTGGRFVFLTYAQAHRPSSGPGRETVHDVSNYSVDTLDRLVVRLVSDELGRLPRQN